jgi:hypothetical protein
MTALQLLLETHKLFWIFRIEEEQSTPANKENNNNHFANQSSIIAFERLHTAMMEDNKEENSSDHSANTFEPESAHKASMEHSISTNKENSIDVVPENNINQVDELGMTGVPMPASTTISQKCNCSLLRGHASTY